MNVSKNTLTAVLSQFNPWWRGEPVPDQPGWRRNAFRDLRTWMGTPSAPRAILLSGAREVGKSTLLIQAVDALLRAGVPAANILYAPLDHPLLRLAGLQAITDAWREREPKVAGPEYLFLDEVALVAGWEDWVAQQADLNKGRRVALSASTLPSPASTSTVGGAPWRTVRVGPLSFYEYLELRGLPLPVLPPLRFLRELFEWPEAQVRTVAEAAVPYLGHFQEYLVRGGFPRAAQADSVVRGQRLLREDIVDRVLKHEVTALFGVRRVLDLEQTFLYLCLQTDSLLDMVDLCANLDVKRPTAQHFIEVLEAMHLIHRLPPFGYGKDILRARFRVLLADPAIAPAMLLRGKSLVDDAAALGLAADTAVFNHLFARYHARDVRFSYWRGGKRGDVDLVAEVDDKTIPLQMCYRQPGADDRALKGLVALCGQRRIARSYVVTRSVHDFGLLAGSPQGGLPGTGIMAIPAALLCFWMGSPEPDLAAPVQT